MRDEKYATMKWGDTRRVTIEGAEYLIVEPRLVLDDAVVIRTLDSFAHSGLVAYAANIQTSLELLPRGAVDPELYDALKAVADYFYDRSEEARKLLVTGHSKLPD